MRTLLALITSIVLTNLVEPAIAQTHDVVGQWQGHMYPGGPRIMLVIRKDAGGGYAGEYYLPDTSPHPKMMAQLDFKDGVFTFLDGPRRYRGKLSADGAHIDGAPFNFDRAPKTGAWSLPAPVPHEVRKIEVDDGVKLEVVDWGGSGPPLIFLAGLGEDAHVFDFFAPRFTGKHHVYGLTRRGFGASDKPDPKTASYSVTRLGDDIVQIIEHLKLEKPALAGWSIAGSEMSSVAIRKPKEVAGLVYLDAAYAYALYAPGLTAQPDVSLVIDANDLLERVRKLTVPGVPPADVVAALDQLIERSLSELRTDLETARAYYGALPSFAVPPASSGPLSLDDRISRAIREGAEKFTGVDVPVLAIYAISSPPQPGALNEQRDYLLRRADEQETTIRAFEAAHPHARVIRLANAQHAVFISNPDEVFREMTAFLDDLKP